MSVTTRNFQYPTLKWREKGDPGNLIMTNNSEPDNVSTNVDDGLTSLSWLQNLNMCMTRLGAPTPPTPPASPVCFGLQPTTFTGTNRRCQSAQGSAPPASKGAIHPRSGLENGACNVNGCNSTGASQQRNGCNARLQNEPEATKAPASQKGEASKKRASTSQSKQLGSTSKCKKVTPEGSPSQSPQCQDVVDYKSDGSVKPPYSYATLICMAMKANKNKMTLSSIYKWIRENFLYYRNADPSWQNSIRHNLSLNKCFLKIPRNKDEPGKGGFWRLDPVYEDVLVDGIFKKRRPQKGDSTETNGEAKVCKRKSRKKNSPSAEMIKYIGAFKVQQETPPSSAESHNLKETGADATELASAVNSIEQPNGHCTFAYTLQPANLVDCEHGNLVHGYATEVCITGATNSECIIESDGNDICWNAILTEADLNELVDPYTDSVAQIIHPMEGDGASNVNGLSTKAHATTAQLTAVEPHELDLIASSSGILEEQQLFYHANALQSIDFEGNSASVLTATSNVVTCINDANMTAHWDGWQPYQANVPLAIDCTVNRNAELILSQIEQGHGPLVVASSGGSSFIATRTTTLMPISVNPSMAVGLQSKHQQHHPPIMTVTVSDPATSTATMGSNSQSPTNFDSVGSQQSWAAALDLDSFSTIEPIPQF